MTSTYVSTGDWREDGRQCRRSIRASRWLAQYQNLRGEEALKLFLRWTKGTPWSTSRGRFQNICLDG